MLVYDITNPKSFDQLDSWREEFLHQVGGFQRAGPLCIVPFACGRCLDWARRRKGRGGGEG